MGRAILPRTSFLFGYFMGLLARASWVPQNNFRSLWNELGDLRSVIARGYPPPLCRTPWTCRDQCLGKSGKSASRKWMLPRVLCLHPCLPHLTPLTVSRIQSKIKQTILDRHTGTNGWPKPEYRFCEISVYVMLSTTGWSDYTVEDVFFRNSAMICNNRHWSEVMTTGRDNRVLLGAHGLLNSSF